MERAIGIINREIQKRESMLMNPEYVLRVNEIKAELSSLKKAESLVKKSNDIQNVSNLFKVYTYSYFDHSKGFKPQHWAKDLTMIIEKDGIKMKLEGKEIQELVASLPRTFGGSY